MTVPFFIQHIWIVPAFPLLGAVMARIISRLWTPSAGRAAIPCISSAGLGISFIWTLAALLQLNRMPAGRWTIENVLFEWFPGLGRAGVQAGTGGIHVGFLLDPLSIVTALMVTAMTVAIHTYAMGVGDIAETRQANFFSCFDLCIASMLMIVLANDLVVLFAGWVMLTVFSYLLVLFSASGEPALKPASHMVLVNCCGDMALLLATLLISSAVGSTRFVDIFGFLNETRGLPRTNIVTAVSILVVAAASVKAAQFPWHFWLTDTVKGAPSVAALMQTVTMIPSGAFLLIRMSPLLRLSPAALWFATLIGAVSILTVGSVAIVENDLKSILAYLAIAQLGFVFLACGLGAFSGGAFHLLTLAIFQCVLVLATGTVIHSAEGESDLRKMGGSPKRVVAYWTMLIGAVGTSWVFPFAGFSAQEFGLAASRPRVLLITFGCALGLATAFCMTRVFLLVFHRSNGAPPDMRKRIEVVSLPDFSLAILAAFAIVVALGAWEIGGRFSSFVAEAMTQAEAVASITTVTPRDGIHSMLLSGLFVLLGAGTGFYLYLWRPYLPGKIAQRCSSIHAVLASAYHTGEFFTSILPTKMETFSLMAVNFDSEIIDGVPVSAFTRLTQSISKILNRFDGDVLNHGIETGVQILRLTSFPARMLQTGMVQTYALLIVGGIVSFLGYVLIFHHGH